MKSKYRRITKQVFFLFAAFFGLCSGNILISCTQEEERTNSSEILPLSISTVTTTTNKEETRSTTTLTDGQIGIFRMADNSAGLSTMNNILYTGISGTWTPTTTNVMATTTTNVAAYYPYRSSYNDPAHIPLPSILTNSQSYSNNLLYYSLPSTGTISGETCQNTFTLTQAYAVVKFVLSGQAVSGAANIVTSLSLYQANLPLSNTINITGSSATYGTLTKQALISTASNVLNDALASGVNVYLIIPPCTLYDTSNTTMKIVTVIDGANYLYTLNLASSSLGGALQAGYMYTVNLNFTPGSIGEVQEANCYMMQPGSEIYIPVSLAEKGNPGNFNSTTSFTSGLLWSDVSTTHVIATPSGRLIKVDASNTPGNSVIYIKNASGDILWSWLIWVTTYDPNNSYNGSTYTMNGNIWMDRNLGAIDVADGTKTFATCGGLMYQWGRKDPFPGSNGTSATAKPIYGYTVPTEIGPTTITSITGDNSVTVFNIGDSPVTYANALSYSILYPLVAFNNWAGSTAINAADGTENGGAYSWINSSGILNVLYDPCPPGWQAPNFNGTSPWSTWASGSSYTPSYTAYSTWTGAGNYPAAGFRTATGGLSGVGTYGECYSSTASGSYGYNFHLQPSGNVDNMASSNRSNLLNVRCIKQ